VKNGTFAVENGFTRSPYTHFLEQVKGLIPPEKEFPDDKLLLRRWSYRLKNFWSNSNVTSEWLCLLADMSAKNGSTYYSYFLVRKNQI